MIGHAEFISVPHERKNIAFETVKSAAVGAISGAGLSYGFVAVLNRLFSGSWNFSKTNSLLPLFYAIGAVTGILNGYSAQRRSTYQNDRFDFTDKHKEQPEMADIVSDALGKTGNQIQRSKIEKTLGDINFWLLIGSFFASHDGASGSLMDKISYLGGRTNHNIFTTGFYLTLLGELCANAINKEQWIGRQRDAFSHADKLIQGRTHAAKQQDGNSL